MNLCSNASPQRTNLISSNEELVLSLLLKWRNHHHEPHLSLRPHDSLSSLINLSQVHVYSPCHSPFQRHHDLPGTNVLKDVFQCVVSICVRWGHSTAVHVVIYHTQISLGRTRQERKGWA